MRPKFITILGPTASGKTTLALQLAQKFRGQIICADSRTIYRGLDIGTAKPTKQQQQMVRHHLLDIVDPTDQFSARDFKQAAQNAMKHIWQEGDLPFLVGGSGMYIDAVLFDYQFRNPRLYPDQRLDEMSLAELVEQATKLYPIEIKNIDSKNRRRVEQLILKGPAKDDDRKQKNIDSLVLGISTNLAQLKENIAIRTEEMLNKGLVQETKMLSQRLGQDNVLLQTTGYGAVLSFLSGELMQSDLKEQIIRDTMALAKKQNTWFRRNQHIHWINSHQQAAELINDYLS